MLGPNEVLPYYIHTYIYIYIYIYKSISKLHMDIDLKQIRVLI
jgi:hypothetical protein